MTILERKLKALEFFKDWSNYMLVTTVAAIGWVTSKEASADMWTRPWVKPLCIWAFGLSSLFAILTLAVIPLIIDSMDKEKASIYEEKPSFKLLWLWGPKIPIKLKVVCWPQHILFMIGIIFYVIGRC